MGKKGPAHIAEVIEEIRKRFELEQRIAELEAEMARASVKRARFGIGGNSPPEAIDDAPRLAKEFTIIWEPLRDLKDETQNAAPNKSKIRTAIDWLTALSAVCGKWTGGTLDAGAKEYVKALGKAGGIATAAWIALKQPEIAAVIDAAKAWLGLL